MKLSVIIPCFNAADTIACQLDALAKQRWAEPWEVILADNGSKDKSVAVANSFVGKVPSLRILDASARKGAPYAMNLAASMARGEYLAICDADDEVAPGWVAAMGKALDSYECVASRFEFARLNPFLTPQSMIMKHPQTIGLVKLWYPPYAVFAGSCGLGVRKSLHVRLGGFDESFFVVYDADYCVRMQLAGARLTFAADALVHIRCRASAEASFSQLCSWGEYNALLYKRYRPVGLKEMHRWKSHARGWVDLVRSLPSCHKAGARLEWVKRLGWQVGILKGSLKHMVPPVPMP
ncbi:glycosyl transferase [Nitrospira sp.]|nr:glycosyl transferase [Nitrospira sp.]